MQRSWNAVKLCWRARILRPAGPVLHYARPNPYFFGRNLSFTQITNAEADTETIDRNLLKLDSEIRKVGRINRHEIEEILEDIRSMRKATSSQTLMILRCCGELVPAETPENRTKLVKEVWKTMESLNVPVDVSHYNALLKVYLENNHGFNPAEFLQELSAKGIEPNRVTYQRLMARYCQDGDIDGASNILHAMKEKQLPINEYVFNSLLMGHANSNDMESAESIIPVMKQAGLEPNDDTYVTLICGYAKHGDMENVHRLIKDCRSKDVFLIDRDFLNIAFALASNGNEALVDEIFPYLQKHSGFNQEAINVILRLISIGKVEIGFKILQQMQVTTRRDEPMPGGAFFIRQLISTEKPSETIVKYCKEMEDLGINKYALVKACEIALESRKFDIAADLLEALRDTGFPIRQHYFWPFFACAKTEKDVYDGLKYMMYLETPPSQETIREYIVPALFSSSSHGKEGFEVTIEKLGAYANLPVGIIFPAALQYVLSTNQMQPAAKYAVRYKLRSLGQSLRRALVEAFVATKDAKSTVRILGSIGGDDDTIAREIAGAFLQDVVGSTRGRNDLFSMLLDELAAAGLGISNSSAELLQNSIGDALTAETSNKISQLVSSELVRRVETYNDLKKEPMQVNIMEEKTTSELESMLEVAKLRGKPTKGLQKALFLRYCADKDQIKLASILQEMDADGFVLGPFLSRVLLEFYCSVNDFEKGKELHAALQQNDLDISMDDTKIIKYAVLLASNGDLEGAEKVLKEHPRFDDKRDAKINGFVHNTSVGKLIAAFAEASSPEKAKEVLHVIVERNLAAPSNYVLGAIIRAYLDKDDVDGAMAEFEQCVKVYKSTPCKQDLFCRLIKSEDAERLQQVLDQSTQIHGEVNSLYDLVFAFLECGKVRQAKKILDTPGLRARNEKLESTCQKYLDDNRIDELENLVHVTKDIFDVDRNSLYMYLLKAYCKLNDADKALSVWTSLQEENVQASTEILIYLADFLRKNDKEVPFVVPRLPSESSKVERARKEVSSKKQTTNLPQRTEGSNVSEMVQDFRKKLEAGHVDECIAMKDRILQDSQSGFSVRDWSALLDKLVQLDRLEDAKTLVNEMIKRNLSPRIPAARRFSTHLSQLGDVETLTRLVEELPEAVQKGTALRKKIGIARVCKGQYSEVLDDVKKLLESNDTTICARNTQHSVLSLTKLLLLNENLVPEVSTLAEIEYQKGSSNLYEVLWSYYFIRQDFEKSNELLTQYLKLDDIRLGVVLEAARKEGPELIQRLWELSRQCAPTSNVRGTIGSCYLDIKQSESITEAMALLKTMLDEIRIEELRASTLRKMRTAAMASGIAFPYQIKREDRNRRKDAASSSDDSDSD